MSQQLTNIFNVASGITWFEIAQRGVGNFTAGVKQLKEDDWVRVGGFRSGTFSTTGDDPEKTEHQYENGVTFFASGKNGTYGLSGNIPNWAADVVKLLLAGKDVDTNSLPVGSYMRGKPVIAAGGRTAQLDNIAVRLRFEAGDIDSVIFPNATVLSKGNFQGSSEEVCDIFMDITFVASNDADDTNGEIYLLVYKDTRLPSVTTKPVINITATGATFTGEFTKGSEAVTAVGFEYQKLGDAAWTNEAVTGTASPFTKEKTGLVAATDYLVRAWAQSASGKSYGTEAPFTTL